MNATAETSAWLKTELTSALGFAEVDDIVAYVLSSFQSKQEVATYLTELLGITPARAETICAKLFAPPQPAQPQTNKTKSKANAKNSKTAGGAASSNVGAAGLVPPAAVPNSRLKQAKVKKTGVPKLMHAQVINCLQCGKIEHNGGRKCLFCGTELRYEELDEHEIDRAAQRHMETLVLYDETSAERTTVIDTEEQFYDEVELRGDDADGHRRPITLDLDLESRQFVMAGRGGAAGRISRNEELSKDARDLCEGIARRMEKENGRQQRKNGGNGRAPADPSRSLVEEEDAAVVVEEEYALVFV